MHLLVGVCYSWKKVKVCVCVCADPCMVEHVFFERWSCKHVAYRHMVEDRLSHSVRLCVCVCVCELWGGWSGLMWKWAARR